MNVYKSIFEGRGSSTLYHGTDLGGAYGILSKNLLKGKNISFARNLSSSYYRNYPVYIIFEINKEKIDAHFGGHYELKSFIYHDPELDRSHFRDEQEELMKIKKGNNLQFDNINNYVKKIIINIFENRFNAFFFESWLEEVIKLISNSNINYEIRVNLVKTSATLEQLSNYSKLANKIFTHRHERENDILFDLTQFFYFLKLKNGLSTKSYSFAKSILRGDDRLLKTIIENASNESPEGFWHNDFLDSEYIYSESLHDLMLASNKYLGGLYNNEVNFFNYKPDKHSQKFLNTLGIKWQ